MNISQYQTLMGLTVPASQTTRITAMLARATTELESLLGYTLDESLVETNHYTEIGKTTSDYSCCTDIDEDSLADPDAVIGAYRLFPYNRNDKYLMIDPASAVHKVKLVKDGITFSTLDESDYRLHYENGFIKMIQRCDRCDWCICNTECANVQLAVDADWLWPDEDDIPNELLYLLADMVDYYSDDKSNIKSETLATHSWTKFSSGDPKTSVSIKRILNKYAGGNSSIIQTLTV